MSSDRQEQFSPAELAAALEQSFAHLCRTLALLKPEERDAPGLDGGWSAKVQLAHVAFWDDFQCSRMEAALAGTSVDGFPRPDHDNEARAAADAQRSWDEVMEAAETARARLVSFVGGLDPAVLTQVFPEGDGQFSIGRQARHMVHHTDSHMRPILQWCGSMARWQDRNALRAWLVAQHARLLAGATDLSHDIVHTVPVCGHWNIRDVLLHVLSWNEHAHELLTQWPNPRPESVAEWPGDVPMDALNVRLMAARDHLDLAEILARLAQLHENFLATFDAADDAKLSSIGGTWHGELPYSCQFLAVADHVTEHADQIWAYRQLREESR